MYAGHVVLISSSAAGLRKRKTLSDFSQRRKLEVNTEITKICVFGGDRSPNILSLLNNHTLEKVQSYKIWFTQN